MTKILEMSVKMKKYLKNKDGVTFITFPSLEKLGVKHGFSTKLGGVSENEFATMNFSKSVGDRSECVMENHRRFAKAVDYKMENLVLSHQVHKADILTVTKDDCGKGVIKPTDISEKDGLVTNNKDVVLMTFFADCVPLFFADMNQGVVGAAHSGWRGTVAKIGAKMIRKMQDEFGCKLSDIYVVVGPSICSKCYEVSEDVAKEFKQSFSPRVWDDILKEKSRCTNAPLKYQLDLWKANQFILLEAGCKEENIEVSSICTCCHSDLLFSHRATGGRRGTLAGVITL